VPRGQRSSGREELTRDEEAPCGFGGNLHGETLATCR
jgi:hypothetical protein